mgnify:CR=1 FL=1
MRCASFFAGMIIVIAGCFIERGMKCAILRFAEQVTIFLNVKV